MNKIKLFLISMIFSVSMSGIINFSPTGKDSVLFAYLDSIKAILDSNNVQEPIYVLAQAIYETGWFKCKNCTWKNNNMFGFRGLNGKYLKFSNWRSCVLYYVKWQSKRYPKYKEKNPNGTYLGFLKWSRFAEAKNYSNHIQITYDWILAHWTLQNN